MGFGAIITSGSEFRPLDEEVMRWVVEVRVEQELSKPTQFAIRFDDDVCGGDPLVANHRALRQNTLIAVFVTAGDDFECLVHGPITHVRTSSMVGGSGSWVEVRGLDRRVELDRIGVQASWTGKASDAARGLLTAHGLNADCEETRKYYSEGQHALNQRGTDLEFLESIARKNDLEFWLDYEVEGSPEAFSVVTNAHLKSSPPRPNAAAANLPPAPPVLRPAGGLEISVQPPAGECATVTRFDAQIDFERPSSARGTVQQAESGTTVLQSASPGDDALGEGRDAIVTVDGVVRTALGPPVTDPDEHHLAQQALLTEASWFVEVDCSTTLELLGFVAAPHQIVDVKHAGERLSGPYQVTKTTHVINATDHFIDFTIRANGLREAGARP